MDTNKIISDALSQSSKDASGGKFSSLPEIGVETLPPNIEQNFSLINYSNILLSIYHEELRKSLTDQGITI